MRAERFGSYSMAATFAVLGALEVDATVHDLMAAAAMAYGDMAVEVPARDPLLRLEQRLFRTLLRDLLK